MYYPIDKTQRTADEARPGARPRVLVVAGHEVVRRVVVRLLARSGCEARAVAGVDQVAEALGSAGGFDAVLFDGVTVEDAAGVIAGVRRVESALGPGRSALLAMVDEGSGTEPGGLVGLGFDGVVTRPATARGLMEALGPLARPALDAAGLLGRCGGDRGLFLDVLASFAREASGLVDWLRAPETLADPGRLAEEAHGLAGMAATAGAARLRASCLALEAAADRARGGAGAGGAAGVGEALGLVVADWDEIRPALASLIGG